LWSKRPQKSSSRLDLTVDPNGALARQAAGRAHRKIDVRHPQPEFSKLSYSAIASLEYARHARQRVAELEAGRASRSRRTYLIAVIKDLRGRAEWHARRVREPESNAMRAHSSACTFWLRRSRTHGLRSEREAGSRRSCHVRTRISPSTAACSPERQASQPSRCLRVGEGSSAVRHERATSSDQHGSHDANFAEPAPTAKPLRPNYTWAELMRRTFAIDVLACQYCGGRLKLLAAVMNPKAVRAILASLH